MRQVHSMLRHPRQTLVRPRPTLVVALAFLAVASLATGNGSRGLPMFVPSAEAASPSRQIPVAPAEAWDKCFRVVGSPQHDPGGQGTRLVGVGASRKELDYPLDVARQFAFEDGFSLLGMTTSSGVAIKDVKITNGELVGKVAPENTQLTGVQWKDVRLSGSLRCPNGTHLDVHARIAQASQADKDSPWVYSVEIQRPGPRSNPAPSWVPACGKNSTAMAMESLWDEKSGKPGKKEGLFSFACTDAIVAKCSQQWGGFSGTLHAACTRMGRADYLGTGDPYTKDHTLVIVKQNVEDLKKSLGQNPEYLFEAAWTQSGVYCVNRPRYPEKIPAAFSSLPSCNSPEAAEAKAGKDGRAGPLLYNASCSPADKCMDKP